MSYARIKEYMFDSKEKDFAEVVERIRELNKNAKFSDEWCGQFYYMHFLEGIDSEREEISQSMLTARALYYTKALKDCPGTFAH